MTKLKPIARMGGRNLYLGPNGRTGMRYPEAKAAYANVSNLRAELDAEVAFSKATGFGDHARISRLMAEIAAA